MKTKENIFIKHQKEYANAMIKTWLSLAKKHDWKVNKKNVKSFYWSDYNDIIIEFTNKGKLLNYSFKEV